MDEAGKRLIVEMARTFFRLWDTQVEDLDRAPSLRRSVVGSLRATARSALNTSEAVATESILHEMVMAALPEQRVGVVGELYAWRVAVERAHNLWCAQELLLPEPRSTKIHAILDSSKAMTRALELEIAAREAVAKEPRDG